MQAAKVETWKELVEALYSIPASRHRRFGSDLVCPGLDGLSRWLKRYYGPGPAGADEPFSP